MQNDADMVDRMRTKWTPPGDSGSPIPVKAVTDCESVLSRLIALGTISAEMKAFLTKVSTSDFALLTLVWRYNSFGHHTDSQALCMYDVTSMMSHSCGASAVWHFGDADAFCLRARVALRPGDEVCISYLADEDLFKSIPIRREKTNGWLFACSCDRCSNSLTDFSRGSRCPTCVSGTVYISPSNEASACDTCASLMEKRSLDRYIELEALYVERVTWIDKKDISDVRAVHKEAVNLFSSQHWVLFVLETYMAENLRGNPSSAKQRLPILTRRLVFLSKTFPMANYTATWLLEEIGDMYCEQDMVEEAVKYFENAYWTMRILCGPDHPFTESSQAKWDDALEQLKADDPNSVSMHE